MTTKTKLRKLLEQAAAVFDDTTLSRPDFSELLGPLDEVLEAAGLGTVGDGTIDFISDDKAKEGDCDVLEPSFTIFVFDGDISDLISLPVSIVDAPDPLAAAWAYAAKKNSARLGLYRAIPRSKLDGIKRYERVATLRAPSNIPFLVDNILEYLRPDHMPSRRHAVYASPTPELALANASAVLAPGDAMVVCELAFEGSVKVAHLEVSDARYHSDVRAITSAVMGALNEQQMGETGYGARAELAPLFMPWLRAHELRGLQIQVPLVRALLQRAAEVSTFWQTASPEVNPQFKVGELFFELSEGAYYTLKPLGTAEHG